MSRIDPKRDDPLGHVHVLPQRLAVLDKLGQALRKAGFFAYMEEKR